jgi:hypothetical protein
MPDLSADDCQIHLALIMHERGTEHYAAATERALLVQLADFCRAHWAKERRRHPSLPELAPAYDAEAIETYFENVSEESAERGTAALAPVGNLRALDDAALADSHASVQLLALSVLRQRGALAAERARRRIAKLARGIASVSVSFERDSVALTTVAFDQAGRPVDLDATVPADDRPQLREQLAEAAATGSGAAVIEIVAEETARCSAPDAAR